MMAWPNCRRSPAHSRASSEGADRHADTARRNRQAGLDEPVLGEFESFAGLTQHLCRRDSHVDKIDLGMLVTRALGESGHAPHVEALGSLVDEKQGRACRVAIHDGGHEIGLGTVGVAGEALLAVDDVVVSVEVRRCPDAAGIRAGSGLRDAERHRDVATACRHQVGRDLFGHSLLEADGWLPDPPPEAIGCRTDLLVDDALLDDRHALAAMLGVVVDGVETVIEDPLAYCGFRGPRRVIRSRRA